MGFVVLGLPTVRVCLSVSNVIVAVKWDPVSHFFKNNWYLRLCKYLYDASEKIYNSSIVFTHQLNITILANRTQLDKLVIEICTISPNITTISFLKCLIAYFKHFYQR